jgi:uncharacterized protein
MVEVVVHADGRAFLARAEAWLLEREAEHNVILAAAYLVAARRKPFDGPAYLATIESGGAVVGCALCPPPDGVHLTEMPSEAPRILAAQLRARMRDIPEVIGPLPVATSFAGEWGAGWRLHSRLQRYVLETLAPPARRVEGALRLGVPSDVALLDSWAGQYGREVGSKVDTSAFFRTMLDRGSLYLWDDDGPRCVVTASGITPNGARISAAFTPPEYRGQGFAANAVGAVSQRILDGGKRFCVISAAIDDPVPNAIYRKLGYQPLGQLALIHLLDDVSRAEPAVARNR